MITISQDGKEIVFTPRDTERGQTLTTETRKLIYGHRCPNCGTIIQALFTGAPLVNWKEYSQQTVRHSITRPPYLAANKTLPDGSIGQYLLEEMHCSLDNRMEGGRCKYTKMIYRRGPFDRTFYLHAICREAIEFQYMTNSTAKLVKSHIAGPNGEAFSMEFLNLCRTHVGIGVDTVNEEASPVWLLAKYDLGWSFSTALDRIIDRQPPLPEPKEEVATV